MSIDNIELINNENVSEDLSNCCNSGHCNNDTDNIELINITNVETLNNTEGNKNQCNNKDKVEILINEDSDDKKTNEINNLENENQSNKTEHKYWVDVLRILSSYMVILVHSSSHLVDDVPILTAQWNGLVIWDSLSRSCVPLFIMISGIFFLDPNKGISLSKLYKKYILRLVKSLFFWNFFYGTVNRYLVNSFYNTHPSTSKIISDFFYYFLFGEFHLWYLYMCIGLYIVTPLLRLITKNKMMMNYFLILGIMITQIIPFLLVFTYHFIPIEDNIISGISVFVNKFMIFIIGGYTTYYVLGFYLSKVDIKNETLLYYIYGLGVISLIGTAVLKFISSNEYNENVNQYGEYNSFNVSVSGIFIFILHKHTINKVLSKFLQNKKFKTALLTISNLSFGCYLIHVFYFDIFFSRLKFYSYTFNTYFFPPIYAFCICVLSYLTAFIIKKIPFLNQFI